jgi:hypothetical protein
MTIRPQSPARFVFVALLALTLARSDTATAAPAGQMTYSSPYEDLRLKQ